PTLRPPYSPTRRSSDLIALAADILHRLHHSGIVWENRMDVFDESFKYEGLLGSARMYDGFEEVKALVYGKVKPRLEALGPEDLPDRKSTRLNSSHVSIS